MILAQVNLESWLVIKEQRRQEESLSKPNIKTHSHEVLLSLNWDSVTGKEEMGSNHETEVLIPGT